MNSVDEALYQAIKESERARSAVKKKKGQQVRGMERDTLRATALTWFHSHRPELLTALPEAELEVVDGMYRSVLEATHRNALRSLYVNTFKEIKNALVTIRSKNVVDLAAPANTPGLAATVDTPPDFSRLIPDPKMRLILDKRWAECVVCVSSGAPLAAVVMIGGLLEGLLLARVHKEVNKAPIFTAKGAPRDKQGKTLTLRDWTLNDYISVAHELNWITVTAKDVGIVLRDYRNYVHPHKELSSGVSITNDDATLLWEIGKIISRQLLK